MLESYGESATIWLHRRASRLPVTRPAVGTKRAIPDRFPRSLVFSTTASVPRYTPMASPRPRIANIHRLINTGGRAWFTKRNL